MSMFGAARPQAGDEVGPTVASFPTYEGAQKAVSALIAAEIPAREIAIVGNQLRSIERITGRLGYARAARSGAVNGLFLGFLFAAIFVLGMPSVQIQVFVGVLLIGIAIGMMTSIVSYSIIRRRRDYASVMQVLADHYEVTVASHSAPRARQVLGVQSPSATRATQPTPDRGEPPQYGQRVTAPPQYGERVDPAPAPVAEQPSPPSTTPAESEPSTAEPERSGDDAR
ncbi:general stress protein [Microbacterium fluvii]|uniref:General stress protein n=1 Tax=Microbacterium fluvii TaxID=415215 RepID=A0ABW2HCM7_9MICO|nr:general stress protein [Microbacterium fluvii]MCU4672247.1 hypothetical protein [Microbacterium fluvii]